MERVQHHGSIEDRANPLLCIRYHNHSKNKRGEVPTSWKSWKGSNIVQAYKIMLIHCWVLSTIMIPRTREEKFLHCGSAERVLYCGNIEECADPLLSIKNYNDF